MTRSFARNTAAVAAAGALAASLMCAGGGAAFADSIVSYYGTSHDSAIDITAHASSATNEQVFAAEVASQIETRAMPFGLSVDSAAAATTKLLTHTGCDIYLDESDDGTKTLIVEPAETPEEGYKSGELLSVSGRTLGLDTRGAYDALVVREGVTKIGDAMDYGTQGLFRNFDFADITIASTVKYIGSYAFYANLGSKVENRAHSLTFVGAEDGTSQLEQLAYNSFYTSFSATGISYGTVKIPASARIEGAFRETVTDVPTYTVELVGKTIEEKIEDAAKAAADEAAEAAARAACEAAGIEYDANKTAAENQAAAQEAIAAKAADEQKTADEAAVAQAAEEAAKAACEAAGIEYDANKTAAENQAAAQAAAVEKAKQEGAASATLKAQSITVNSFKAFKAKKVKKAAKSFKAASAKGKLTIKKLKGAKKITVKGGKITVKKGTKKGVYKIKVKISAAATGSYAAASTTAFITVQVK